MDMSAFSCQAGASGPGNPAIRPDVGIPGRTHTHTLGSQPFVFSIRLRGHFWRSGALYLAMLPFNNYRDAMSRGPCVVMSLGKKSPIIRSPRYSEFYDHNVLDIKFSFITCISGRGS
jgi:hypothetical protein